MGGAASRRPSRPLPCFLKGRFWGGTLRTSSHFYALTAEAEHPYPKGEARLESNHPGNCRCLQLVRPAASVGSRESPATLLESTAFKISRLGLAVRLTTGPLCNVAERNKSAGTLRRRAGQKSVRFGVYNRPYMRVSIWRSPASRLPGSNDTARR